MTRPPKPGPYQVSLATLRDRLAASEVPPKMWGLRDTLSFERTLKYEPDAVGLWVDKPWHDLRPAALRCSPSKTVAVVFTKPIDTERSLVLSSGAFLGFELERDELICVFLAPVKVRDFCTVPGTLAVFARGLTVSRIASFDGPDCHTSVGGHLKAPYVASGISGAAVFLEPNTKVVVKEYARHIYGLPKNLKVVKHPSLKSMWPFLGKRADDQETWAVVSDFIDTNQEIPKGAAVHKPPSPKPNHIRGNTFMFSGRLELPSALVKTMVKELGGAVATKMTPQLSYLVVGDARSALRKQGPKSSPQLAAEALNTKGASIKIIREEAFWAMKIAASGS